MVKAMNSAWKKNQRREISHTLGRYLAIMAIVALGVGFFAGLKVTRRSMIQTGDTYIAAHRMYDYRQISSLGLTESDVSYFNGLDGVKDAEGSVTLDFIAGEGSGSEMSLRAHSITERVNTLTLKKGRMPQAPDECVADALVFGAEDIGKKLAVARSNDPDTADQFAFSEYTIVGIADSVCYLNRERGTTKLPGGTIHGFVFIPADGFSTDYYTEVYVALKNGGEIYSDAYKTVIASMKTPLQDALNQRADVRYQDILGTANTELSDAEEKYADALDDYNTKKADAEAELEKARQKLDDARIEIEKNESRLKEGEKKLQTAQAEYDSGMAAYESSEAQFQSQKTAALEQLDAAQKQIDAQSAAVNASIRQLEESGMAEQSEQYPLLLASREKLTAAQAELDAKKTAAEKQLATSESELSTAKNRLDAAKVQIDANRKTLATGRKQLEKAKTDYESGTRDYESAKSETDQKLADAEKQLSNGKGKIDDAKTQIAKLKSPSCYLFDRTANTGYACFESDASIVEGIARIFPLFFFLVAALVCTTTMTRMVEEQRTQIGTLKALGYGNGAIVWKYISYSGSSALLGCILGFTAGSKLFPWAIWTAYSMLYGFADIGFVFDTGLAAVSLAVALLCSAGATYTACRTELSLMPAELMRPKTPKSGKRLLLERLPALWNRISFLRKVSIRNIFRYKKRLIMMILGIGGCTALVLTGFGLRDSIGTIVDDQFGKIMKYDFQIVFEDAKTDHAMKQFVSETAGLLTQCVFVHNGSIDVVCGNGVKSTNLMATDDPRITDLVDLHRGKEKITYPPLGSVAINEKLAAAAGVSTGDKITVKLSETETRTFTVGGIFENYVYNYMLMTAETYKSVLGEDCEYTCALAVAADGDAHAISSRLISEHGAAAVSVVEDIRSRVGNMMKSLNYIILLVIACAGALAFVVLFNLSNINITERVREIATIKVLGFYPAEVGAYVFRENIVLTAGGALIGLPLGVWLHGFVMSQIKIDMVSFNVHIQPQSFAFALIMTFAFTFASDLIMRGKLERISMTESLKSVE